MESGPQNICARSLLRCWISWGFTNAAWASFVRRRYLNSPVHSVDCGHQPQTFSRLKHILASRQSLIACYDIHKACVCFAPWTRSNVNHTLLCVDLQQTNRCCSLLGYIRLGGLYTADLGVTLLVTAALSCCKTCHTFSTFALNVLGLTFARLAFSIYWQPPLNANQQWAIPPSWIYSFYILKTNSTLMTRWERFHVPVWPT